MLKKKALWKFRKILKKHIQNAFSKLENNNSFSYKTHQLKFQKRMAGFLVFYISIEKVHPAKCKDINRTFNGNLKSKLASTEIWCNVMS